MGTDGDDAGRRPGIPLSAVILATVAATLVTALFVAVILDTDGGGDPDREKLNLQPGEPGAGIPTGEDPSGTAAPDFSFEALDVDGVDLGDDVDFADYRAGRPVVVNFFASWCAPCVREMPDFEAAHQQFGATVTFIGLAERESAEDSIEIVQSTGVTYDIGRDPGGDIITAFEGLAMPTTVFIAADGTITSVHSGALTADDLRERIETELL